MEIFLKGNYKSFSKLILIRSKKPTNFVLINIHGLYGLSGDRGSKSRLLGRAVADGGIAHSVLFSSSRDWDVYREEDPQAQAQAFVDKTFQNEADDLRDVIDVILDQSSVLFGIKKGRVKLFVVGNSLGGTLVSTLSDKFEFIKKIVLCGSGTGSSSSTKPLLSTCPPEDEILTAVANFRGQVMLLQGSEDMVVPKQAQDKLLSGYKNARTTKLVVEGANHNFSKVFGRDKKLAYNLYVDSIVKFFSE